MLRILTFGMILQFNYCMNEILIRHSGQFVSDKIYRKDNGVFMLLNPSIDININPPINKGVKFDGISGYGLWDIPNNWFVDDFTFTTWAKFHDEKPNPGILAKQKSNTHAFLIYRLSSGVFAYYNNANTPTTTSTEIIPINEWVHLGVRNKNNIITLFINGEIVDEYDDSSTNFQSIADGFNTSYWGLASRRINGNNDGLCSVTLSCPMIINRSLTNSEYNTLYTNEGLIPSGSKWGWGSKTILTSGSIEVGEQYRINTYISGDDFTNVGASSNESGVEFIATGDTPSIWTNSSELEKIGIVSYLPMNELSGSICYDESPNGYDAILSNDGWERLTSKVSTIEIAGYDLSSSDYIENLPFYYNLDPISSFWDSFETSETYVVLNPENNSVLPTDLIVTDELNNKGHLVFLSDFLLSSSKSLHLIKTEPYLFSSPWNNYSYVDYMNYGDIYKKYMIFDGVDDHVNYGDILNISKNDPLTINLKFSTSSTNTQILIAKSDINVDPRGWILNIQSDGRVRLSMVGTGVGTSFSLNGLAAETSNSFNDGIIHELYVMYDGSSDANGISMSIDGINQSMIVAYNTLSDEIINTCNFKIGNRDADSAPFDGIIYDVNVNNEFFAEGYGNIPFSWRDKINNIIPTINGSPLISSEIKTNNKTRMLFDGDDDYINYGNILNKERTDAFFIELTFKKNSTDTGILIGNLDSYTPHTGFEIAVESTGKISCTLCNTYPDNRISVATTNSIYNDNKFHKLKFEYDGSSDANGINFYVDDILVPKTINDNTLTSSILTSNSLLVGIRDSLDFPFNGIISNINFNNELIVDGYGNTINDWTDNTNSISPISINGNPDFTIKPEDPNTTTIVNNPLNIFKGNYFIGNSTYFNSTYIRTENNSEISGSDPRTISLWLRFDNVSPSRQYFYCMGNHGTSNQLFAFARDNGEWFFHGYDNDISITHPTANLTDLNWHHHGIVYDGSILKWYIDGEEILSQNTSLNTANSPIIVGGRINTTDPNDIVESLLGAEIDDIKVIKEEKSENWIKYIYMSKYTIDIDSTNTSIPTLTKDFYYNYELDATTLYTPITWNLSGKLPNGIDFNKDGEILGQNQYELQIANPEKDSKIPKIATVWDSFNFNINTLGINPEFSLSGDMPFGLELKNGKIQGIPNQKMHREINGRIVIEAENMELSPAYVIENNDSGNTSGYSGRGYIRAIVGWANGNPPRWIKVPFKVNSSSNWSLYIRRTINTGASISNSDSIYWAITPNIISRWSEQNTIGSSSFNWYRLSSNFSMSSGIYNLMFAPREANFCIDKIIIQNSSFSSPIGLGPDETF